jgi:hypothetical protein
MQGLLDSRKRLLHGKSLTLFGRSVALISGEVLANAVIWIAAGICFAREADGLLGLALLAWVRESTQTRDHWADIPRRSD